MLVTLVPFFRCMKAEPVVLEGWRSRGTDVIPFVVVLMVPKGGAFVIRKRSIVPL